MGKTIKYLSKTRKKKLFSSIKKKPSKAGRTYKRRDYISNDGMLTSVWGPPLWHVLHCISFNYPNNPTVKDKKYYRQFVMNLKNILPCKYCRDNLKKNFKRLPLKEKDLKNRTCFSKWIFKLHEVVNTMLGKKSGLKYCDIRERYEHFRSRCVTKKDYPSKKINKFINKTRKKEKGCTESFYGSKSKCIVKIVPKDKKEATFQMDKECIKNRI
tara:strand:- start:414 stop:1052 length:639 start_codon:yes stop_codon:yes gene_type:complete